MADSLLPRSQGFTLIEIMVVLIIVGVLAGSVSLGLDVLQDRDADRHIERLRLVLEASSERASLRGQPIAIELLNDGYRFTEYGVDGRWHALEKPPLFTEQRLPEGFTWGPLRQGGAGSKDQLIFGTQPPRFELELKSPQTAALYVGRETGQVALSRLNFK